jgi:probable rRNA maturation factor
MLAALELDNAELSVALTDDREIHELNRSFRRRDKPTDVLAFSMREGVGPPPTPAGEKASCELLGDVVISVDTARRQAAERGRSIDDEVCVLLAHGLLHLLGYDHRTRRQELSMDEKTSQLCRAAARSAIVQNERNSRMTAKPSAPARRGGRAAR